MSEPCEFEFVPRKRVVQDSVAQIGNHSSKSEALVQSETALDAGETKNYSTDQLEAKHQRGHKDARYFWIPEQVQDEDFNSKKENISQILERDQSLLQHCNVVQIARSALYKTMDPTLHYKVKADEVSDGSGEKNCNPDTDHDNPDVSR